MTTIPNRPAGLKDLVEFIAGFKCSVRTIKKGSMKNHYIIQPLSIDHNLWEAREELQSLGFVYCSADSAHLPVY